MKILLIQPRWDGLGFRRKIKVDERRIHPLSAAQVAACSGDAKVRIIDEAIETIPDDVTGYDLVGISTNTYTSRRAFLLADRFRRKGVPVVLGGVHTSLMPLDCLAHADSIVLGDAEDTWPLLLRDFEAGSMRNRYVSANRNEGKAIPPPRRDLFKPMRRDAAYCQVTRGCLNHCSFCYLQYVSPGCWRRRDPGEVVEELRSIRERIILFADDNLFCDRSYAHGLLDHLIPLGKKWWIQAPTDIHDDGELIRKMSAAGCFSVSIGFQTFSGQVIADERIEQNEVENYVKLVTLLHKHGIFVDGTFIFGFDGDTPNTFDQAERMIRKLKLDSYTFYFMTPYPGTPYYRRFEERGRILHDDYSRFDWDHVVVEPARMSPGQLEAKVAALYRRLDFTYLGKDFSRAKIAKLASSFETARFLSSVWFSYMISGTRRTRAEPSVPCG